VFSVQQPSARSRTIPLPVGRVWRGVCYGWLFSVHRGPAEWFASTAVSYLHIRILFQLDEAGADGTVRFGDRHGAGQAGLRRSGDGRGVLSLSGDVVPVDLVPLPELPDACCCAAPKDPLTTFDVFGAAFAGSYSFFRRQYPHDPTRGGPAHPTVVAPADGPRVLIGRTRRRWWP
jgi:hypothetical protein